MRVAIFGAGGLGAVALDILSQTPGSEVIGFYDDRRREPYLGRPILGTQAELGQDLDIEGVAIALGDGYAAERQALAERIAGVGLRLVSAVHPRAAVSPLAMIGQGCIVCAGTVINPRADLGSHCVLYSGAIVEHDCRIGSNCYFSPGAIACGYVTIGDHSFLGAGSVIAPDVTLGENVTVGAGAVVLANVPARHVVAGVPAAILRVKEALSYY